MYTNSVFDGCILLQDIHGKPFLISEGDSIVFTVSKQEENGKHSTVFTLSLTCSDEVSGRYPFKILPNVTANLYGLYFYHVSVHFADGDIYTAVPLTKLHALLPFTCMNIHENKNDIIAVVPRVMAEYDNIPFETEIAEYLDDFQRDTCLTAVKCNGKLSVVFVRDFPDCLTSDELVQHIQDTARNYGLTDFFVSGLFHTPPEQYQSIFSKTFGNRFIDVQAIIKTPVFENTSDTVISSIAFDIMKQTPSPEDIIAIHNACYPECILTDETHFNHKGLILVAKIILDYYSTLKE